MTREQRNTEVVPFSNGSDANFWQESNCERCQKSPVGMGDDDTPASMIRAGGCKLCLRLDMGFMTGSITAQTARRMGAANADFRRQGDTVFVTLPRRCKEFEPLPEFHEDA